MKETLMKTDVAGLPNARGSAPDLPSCVAAFEATARAQTEAIQYWIALSQEMWLRAVAVRDPLELASLPSLMLPEFASQAMLYCKRLAEIIASQQTANGSDRSTAASGIERPADAADTRNQSSPTHKRAIRSLPFRGE
jgi:phasin family protein